MKPINAFLLRHGLRIAQNPCISPDFCLDWPALAARAQAGAALQRWVKSGFDTAAGRWTLCEDEATGDCAWECVSGAGTPGDPGLEGGVTLPSGARLYPATWENLLVLKNRIQEFNANSTIFPTTGGRLGRSTLGVGARFTTLHWPAVEWAMSALEIGLTANQNSIPRELVYDVDAMLDGRLDTVPFPFIGASVPEGHQGQSVEGMSHGAVLSKLKTGFHHRRIAWSFNADHQPIGGKFDAREEALVRGSLLASYITFDLSPELALGTSAAAGDIPASIRDGVRRRVTASGCGVQAAEFDRLLATVWPAMRKMKRRDELYRAARERAFTTEAGRRYLRELSIDELPGLTTPETTALMLALCAELGLEIHFIAPAFGFQKNSPYPDNAALRELISRQWHVCQHFNVSIGFHSGSGKSAENYRIMGEVTGSRLEIKTSGRYTYEMGVALFQSDDPADQALWRDWYAFTRELALAGAASADATERRMARSFLAKSLNPSGSDDLGAIGDDPAALRRAVEALTPSPDHMFFFEYNFLFVLAADGRPEKQALGDHSAAGYRQRARFYAISPKTRLAYAKRVAEYLVFLAAETGLVSAERAAAVRRLLSSYTDYARFLDDISR